MTALSLRTTENNGRRVVTLAGEIDLTNSSTLQTDVETIIESASGPVIMDWSQVGFCDSSGINTVVVLARHARTHSIGLALAGVRGRVANVFTLTSLDRVVPLYPDVDAALQALPGSAEHQTGA
jgi:anti-sigma B factor antagonist